MASVRGTRRVVDRVDRVDGVDGVDGRPWWMSEVLDNDRVATRRDIIVSVRGNDAREERREEKREERREKGELNFQNVRFDQPSDTPTLRHDQILPP